MRMPCHLVAAFGFSCLVTSAAWADHPEPSQIRIEDVEYSGTGCPAGTASVALSEDAQAITIAFDQYTVEFNPDRPVRLASKQCTLDIHLDVSSGWTFGLFSIDSRGYADIGQSVVGTAEMSYRFHHESRLRRLGSMRFNGPTQKDYLQSFDIPMNQVSWSPCDEGKASHFIIQSTASLRAVGPVRGNRKKEYTGLLTVDTLDGEYREKYGIVWKECGNHPPEIDPNAGQGLWVQTNGRTLCPKACSDRGMKAGADAAGAECVSGEARPTQAAGDIEFPLGCWGGCAGQGIIATKASGLFCYQPGQKKDFDRTDMIVGCYCRR